MVQEVVQQRVEIEPLVETVGESAEVLAGVLAELEGLVGAVDHRLEVAKHSVDPAELRQLAGLALAHHDVRVCAAGVDHTGKTGQAVAANIAAWGQVHPRPGRDGLAGEAGQATQFDPHRMPRIVGRDGCNYRHFVVRSASDHTRTLAAEIGVIHLHQPSQRQLAVALGHCRHHLLVDQPSRAIAGAELALERQRRQPCLGLADQEDRQKPGAQRQLGAVHHRARRQGGLVPAVTALEELALAVADNVVRARRTTRAPKATRPAHRHQRRSALILSAIALEEFRHANTALKLQLIHCHRWFSKVYGSQLIGTLAHRVSLTEVRDESGFYFHLN